MQTLLDQAILCLQLLLPNGLFADHSGGCSSYNGKSLVGVGGLAGVGDLLPVEVMPGVR